MPLQLTPPVNTWTSIDSPWIWRAWDGLMIIGMVVSVEILMVVWAVTNVSGQMQNKYLLPIGAPASMRIMVILACACIPIAFAKHDRSIIWRLLISSIVIMANTFTGVTDNVAFLFPFSVAYAIALVIGIYATGGGCIRFTGTSWVLGWIVIGMSSNEALSVIRLHGSESAFTLGLSSIVVGGGIGIFTGVAVSGFAYIQSKIAEAKLEWIFYPAIILILITIYLVLAMVMPRWKDGWYFVGPQLYLCGYLAVVKSVFDLTSVSLTRYLVLNGIRRGGIAPIVCGGIDLVMSIVISVISLLVVISLTKLYNYVAAMAGGAPVVDIRKLADGIRDNPLSPEYYWIYGLLFVNVMPCIINIVIASTAILRCLPPLHSYIIRRIESVKAGVDEFAVAIMISGVWVMGVILAAVVVLGCGVGVVRCVIPLAGMLILRFT